MHYHSDQTMTMDHKTTWTSQCYHHTFLCKPPCSVACTHKQLHSLLLMNVSAHINYNNLTSWPNGPPPFPLKTEDNLFQYSERLVIVDNSSLKRGVISLYHDSPTAGHPGISNMTWAITKNFWWPALKKGVTKYIQGCTICQSRKNKPNKSKPPLFPISSEAYSTLFTSIAMDFIVKLPISESYDTILTITDTFSKASIFIPCNKTINAKHTAKLYATYILPHYGLPTCIISDRDPCFTSTFS